MDTDIALFAVVVANGHMEVGVGAVDIKVEPDMRGTIYRKVRDIQIRISFSQTHRGRSVSLGRGSSITLGYI